MFLVLPSAELVSSTPRVCTWRQELDDYYPTKLLIHYIRKSTSIDPIMFKLRFVNAQAEAALVHLSFELLLAECTPLPTHALVTIRR